MDNKTSTQLLPNNSTAIVGNSIFGTSLSHIISSKNKINLYIRPEEKIYLYTYKDDGIIKYKVSKQMNGNYVFANKVAVENYLESIDTEKLGENKKFAKDDNLTKKVCFDAFDFIKNTKINPFKNNTSLPENIEFYCNLESLIKESTSLIIAIPHKFLKNFLENLKKIPEIKNLQQIVSVAKGIDKEDLNVTRKIINVLKVDEKVVYVIMGPNIASEIHSGIITTSTFGGNFKNNIDANKLIEGFKNVEIVEGSEGRDVVELIGGIKNVITIVMGLYDYMANFSALIEKMCEKKIDQNFKNPEKIQKLKSIKLGINTESYILSLSIKESISLISNLLAVPVSKVAEIYMLNCGIGDLTASLKGGRNYKSGQISGKNFIENFYKKNENLISDDFLQKIPIESLKNLQGVENINCLVEYCGNRMGIDTFKNDYKVLYWCWGVVNGLDEFNIFPEVDGFY